MLFQLKYYDNFFHCELSLCMQSVTFDIKDCVHTIQTNASQIFNGLAIKLHTVENNCLNGMGTRRAELGGLFWLNGYLNKGNAFFGGHFCSVPCILLGLYMLQTLHKCPCSYLHLVTLTTPSDLKGFNSHSSWPMTTHSEERIDVSSKLVKVLRTWL